MTERVKTPTVLQMEAVECGAASLAMVLAYYGKFVPLEELRIACGVSRDGSNAAGMMKAARSYGLTTKAFKKEPEGLQQLSFPQIIFWKFNHFMVLEGFTDDGVYANDPDGGRRFIPKEEFDESFTGVTLTFEPGPNFQTGGRRAPVAKQLLKRLRNSRSTLVFLGIAALALIVPAIVVPGSTRVLVDDFFVGQRSDSVQMVLAALLGAVIVTAGLVWLQQFHLLRLQVKLGLRMSTEFFWHVLRLPMGFFSQRSVGDIAWRVSLNEQISQMLAGPISTDVLGLVTAGFFMILMVYLAPLLAAVSLLLVALNVYGARFSQKRRGDLNASLLRELGKIQSVSVQGLITIETLKASGGESDFFVRWSGTLARVLNAREKLRTVEQPLAVLPFFMVTLTTVGVLGVGGLQVLSGDISIGTLIAFQVLLSLFLVPVTGFVEVYGQVEDIRGSLARLQDVLDYELDPEAAHDEADAGKGGKLTGRVELQGITFGYNPNAPPLLQDLSAELQPGGRLAFVGASGSGKSTTARVAAGLYPAWKGSVLFDGTPRHEIPRGVLASSVALVDQSIVLFKGTVRDNITLWDPTIPEHDVIRAARDACIHEDISTRVGGYSGPVEEGGRNFSGGQRQRLEIARALARNPSVLILDEATSALDPLTEMLVDRNLRRRGCTCIVISHRLSTIRDADEIIVLDKGDVVQRGTHDSLKDLDGVYARLIGSDHA